MYSLIAKNKYGETVELTHNPAYDITEIDGIDPAEAVINVSKNAGADGSVFNSAYVNDRQITITLCVNHPTEINRIALYQFFKPKFPVTLYYKNASRDVYINGYVQGVQIGFFEKKQTIQIVITCPMPFFNGSSVRVQSFSDIENLFEFPFSVEMINNAIMGVGVVGTARLSEAVTGIEFSRIIEDREATIVNYGDVETGGIIRIYADGTVVTPKIFNTKTNEYFILNTTLIGADEVIINTRRGEKSVTLLRSGVKSNIVGTIAPGSSWFQLAPGNNTFMLGADASAENMQVTFEIINQYEGV